MISEQIATWLIHSESISEKEKDIYLYGIRLSIAIFINIMASLVIGLAFGMVVETIIFLLILIPLRINAGGMHASTYIKCFILSCLLLIGILILIKYLDISKVIHMSVITISTAVIAFFSPVEDPNKPLENIEIIVYGHRTRGVLLLYILLAWFLYVCENSKLICIESVTLIMVAWILVIGAIKNYFCMRKTR